MNRPLVWAAAGLAAGTALGAQLSPTAWLSILAAFALAAWAASSRSLAVRDRALIVTVFLAAGMLQGNLRAASTTLDPLALHVRDDLPSGAVLTLEGIARSGMLYRAGENSRFVLDVDTVWEVDQPRALRGGVSVRCYEPTGPIHTGERVRVRGSITPVLAPVNFSVNSIEDYLRLRGVHTALRAPYANIERIEAPAWSPGYWLSRLRQAEADQIARLVPTASVPFILAVWLGESGTIARSEYDDFIASGTAHVLSVSGVHVAIIGLALNAVMAWFVRNRKWRAAIVIVAVFAYAALAGAQIATLRSALMFALFLGAEWLDREPDAPTSLAAAALLFLGISPAYIFDVGFLLSFSSIASILLFNDVLHDRLPWRLGYFRGAVATAISAQLLSLPFAAHASHVIPVYGVLANLFIVPLLTLILWLCVLTSALGAVYSGIGLLFGHAVHLLVLLTRGLVAFFATLPGNHLMVTSPAWYAVPLFWLAALLAMRALRAEVRVGRAWAWAGACMLAVALLWSPWPDAPGLDQLDVGHGDALFVRTPGGTTILIDGGDKDEFRDLGQSVVLPFLLANGVKRLDYVVVSHPDRDHIGGLFTVLRTLRVDHVLMSASESDAPLERSFVALCAARGVPITRMKRGDQIETGGATLEVLHPPEDWGEGQAINNRSLVLRIAWPTMSILCSGDIERSAEELLAHEGDCAAKFIKVPHHGSGTSSTQAFLDTVQPRAALCSSGARPNRRPMDEAVRRRYERGSVLLYRTDQLGGLRVHSEANTWKIQGAREARGYSLAPAGEESDQK